MSAIATEEAYATIKSIGLTPPTASERITNSSSCTKPMCEAKYKCKTCNCCESWHYPLLMDMHMYMVAVFFMPVRVVVSNMVCILMVQMSMLSFRQVFRFFSPEHEC